jgi:hypothetical protein
MRYMKRVRIRHYFFKIINVFFGIAKQKGRSRITRYICEYFGSFAFGVESKFNKNNVIQL